ncbi:hypothetical protein C1645_792280 [Glomus cerebriforme]|uniref:F-box domain-containing protein n=1 Tax=Glomus cerebriforme TaxID=658196 RepID=A0A397SCU6_9GLOM|nr:hypothetical protein C1645_792280 [Glomus cerebriforme]
MNHLLKFLCKHCYNLTLLDIPFTRDNINNETIFNMIELLSYKGSNGRSKLNDLKELFYADSVVHKKDIYLALSNNNICNLTLLHNEGFSFINSLSQFITLQKKLKHIILCENLYGTVFYHIDRECNYNIVFNSLSTQSESLQTLEFKYVSFENINENALNSLCLLKNIKGLKLYECKRIDSNLISWAKNLTNLEVFEFVKGYFPIISEEFLIQLIQSSSNTLTKLIIYYGRRERQLAQLFRQIPIYLRSLIHLDLPKTYPDELISIFGSCTKLIYLSIVLSDDGLWEVYLSNLGKFIPKNLQKIQFKEIDRYIFSSKALRNFFEDCKYNNGKLKYLEIKGTFNFGQHYFNVAKEFDIELIQIVG